MEAGHESQEDQGGVGEVRVGVRRGSKRERRCEGYIVRKVEEQLERFYSRERHRKKKLTVQERS